MFKNYLTVAVRNLFRHKVYSAINVLGLAIGIRKVMGASVWNLVRLLPIDFVVLVALDNLIAWPVAYYAMDGWLQDFAYRIDLGVWAFALGGMLALGIALATVGAQAFRAARANPVESLRYE